MIHSLMPSPGYNRYMASEEELHTMAGIVKAIAWLEQMGRPILAAKMERELLYTVRDNNGHGGYLETDSR
jgi:hypothetical protein